MRPLLHIWQNSTWKSAAAWPLKRHKATLLTIQTCTRFGNRDSRPLRSPTSEGHPKARGISLDRHGRELKAKCTRKPIGAATSAWRTARPTCLFMTGWVLVQYPACDSPLLQVWLHSAVPYELPFLSSSEWIRLFFSIRYALSPKESEMRSSKFPTF